MKASPLTIYQGDDYRAMVNVTQNGTPVDLSTWSSPQAQIRKDVADNDTTVEATFTCSLAGSTVTLTLANTVTVGLAGCYVWDLQVNTSIGERRTIARGPVHVTQEVTR